MREVFCILLLLAVTSCSSEMSYQRNYWKPSEQQLSQAEEIARHYAYVELGITKEQLNEMKTIVYGIERAGQKCLRLHFFNTKIHPNWEKIKVMEGGFPDYFVIYIDTASWAVVDHYATRE